MLVHFYLTNDTLFDLIRFRVLDAYRPVAGPVQIDGKDVYMDGLENITITRAGAQPLRNVDFIINVPGSPPTPVVPAPGAALVKMPAVTLGLGGQLFTIDAADLPTDPDPANGVFPRPRRSPKPLIGAQITLSITIDPSGSPVLNATMVQPPAGVDPNGPLWQSIASLTNVAIPLPLGGALSGVVGPGARVLNGGIASTSNDAGFAIRLEVEDPQLPSPNDRLAAWSGFFAGQQPSQLGIRAWAAEVPTTYLLQMASSQFDQQMQSPSVEKIFTNYDPSWAGWTWDRAQLTLQKRGVFEHACAGVDIRATMKVTVTLSVPEGNTLRVSMHIDIDKDDWDSFKCDAFSVLNPIAGIITAFDNQSLLPWYAGIGVAVAPGLCIPVLMLALAFTNNSFLINMALKSAQEALADAGTTLIRTSETDGYVDVPLTLGALGTAAWLTLQEVAGAGDHLVLRGDYRPPNFGMPLVFRGTLLEGFNGWGKPKCEAPLLFNFKTSAELDFSLLDPSGHPVRRPVLPVKCGVDGKTGQTVCWRIVDDFGGVYAREETLVHWSGAGVPGVFEVVVGNPPLAFAEAPYPLHLQVFTSYGTRQFNVAAPPPVTHLHDTPEEKLAEAAQRISDCYAKSSLFGIIKAFQVYWLPTPQPGYKAAQHWQIQVGGLSREERIRAWDAERGTLLAEVRAWGDNFAELSLLIDHDPVRVLQITRNDQPMLPMEEYRDLSARVVGTRETALNAMKIQQTSLLALAEYALPRRADGVKLRVSESAVVLVAWDRRDAWQIALQPRAFHNWAITRAEARGDLRPSLPDSTMRIANHVHEGRRMVQLFSAGGEQVGSFFVRPWYDRGSAAGRFYARLNEAGDHVVLYARCLPRLAEPQMGGKDAGSTA